MSNWRDISGYCMSDGVPRRAFMVALVVGAILNLINQGDALLSGAHLNSTKIILTFLGSLLRRYLRRCLVPAAVSAVCRPGGRRLTLESE